MRLQAALCVAAGLSALMIFWIAGPSATDSRETSAENLAASLAADASVAEKFQPTAFGRDDGESATGSASHSVLGPALEASDTKPTRQDAEPVTRLAMADPSDMLPADAAAEDAAKQAIANPIIGPVKLEIDSTEVLDECMVADLCIDRYLWALYQRTPKEDTIKEEEQIKVTVKKRGKRVTVTRTITRHVDEDFAWKDRKAAERAGKSMSDYVVGGVDQGFKRRLFYLLHAAEQAGLSPGITSAFRDDYRQSIASGLKAADDRSYHGGSFRGGYGHGLAADVVSVKGETRAQRLTSSETLWKWIDTHGQQFGVGRPYLDHDPPHLAPIDGQEYARHHGGTTARETSHTHDRHAASKPHATKHRKTAGSSRARAS